MTIDPQLRRIARQVDRATLGRRIRDARLGLGLTQADVMDPVASSAYLSRIEAGARRPNVEILAHIARRLGLEPEVLLAPTSVKKPQAKGRAQAADAAQARETAAAAATWLRTCTDTTAYRRMVRAALRWENLPEELDHRALGGRIRDARLSLGLTQVEVIGPVASAGHLSRIEAGAKQPSPDLLDHIAHMLGTDAETLLMGPAPIDPSAAIIPHDLASARAAAHATVEWLRSLSDPNAYSRLVSAIAEWEDAIYAATAQPPR